MSFRFRNFLFPILALLWPVLTTSDLNFYHAFIFLSLTLFSLSSIVVREYLAPNIKNIDLSLVLPRLVPSHFKRSVKHVYTDIQTLHTQMRLIVSFADVHMLVPALFSAALLVLIDTFVDQLDAKLMNLAKENISASSSIKNSNSINALFSSMFPRFPIDLFQSEVKNLGILRICSIPLIFASRVVEGVLFARAIHYNSVRIRNRMYARILGLCAHAQASVSLENNLSMLLERDCATIAHESARILESITTSCLRMVLGFYVAFKTDAKLALGTGLACVPFVVALIPLSMSRVSKYHAAYQDFRNKEAKFTAETTVLNALLCIRRNAAEAQMFHRYAQINQGFLTALKSFNVQETTLLYSGAFVNWILEGTILVGGVVRVSKGELDLGSLYVFRNTILSIATSIKVMGSLTSRIAQVSIVANKIDSLDSLPTESTQLEGSPCDNTDTDLRGNLKFDSVTFQYPGTCTPAILSQVSFTASRGQLVALCGSSGSGKSTLLSLIPRLYDVTDGKILYDGIDIRSLAYTRLRNRIGVIEQEPVIFSLTIFENIAFGSVCQPHHGDISILQSNIDLEAKVRSVAKAANAHDFIMSLPKGYHTIVGEGGHRLSLGQKQRIGIARTMMRNPEILICDEITSALDAESEALIHQALKILVKAKTVIMVTHQLSNIVEADKILFLENGTLIEQGTHQELLKLGGRYAAFYKIQSSLHT